MSKKNYTCVMPEYDEYDLEPEFEFNTIDRAIAEIPKKFPSITAKKDRYDLVLTTSNLNELKHAFICLCYANGEQFYQQLCANGKLDAELESLDFFGAVGLND